MIDFQSILDTLSPSQLMRLCALLREFEQSNKKAELFKEFNTKVKKHETVMGSGARMG